MSAAAKAPAGTLDSRIAGQAQRLAGVAARLRAPDVSELARAAARRDLAAIEAELWQLAADARHMLALILAAGDDTPPGGRAA